jgi:hypothetical protein
MTTADDYAELTNTLRSRLRDVSSARGLDRGGQRVFDE